MNLNQLLFVSLELRFEVGDGLLVIFNLSFELLLFLCLQLADDGFSCVKIVWTLVLGIEQLVFKSLVVVRYVDYVQTQGLVVLLDLLELLFHNQEVPFQGNELHLQVPFGLQRLI